MTKKDKKILMDKITDFIDSTHNLRRLIKHDVSSYTQEYFKFLQKELDEIKELWENQHPWYKS